MSKYAELEIALYCVQAGAYQVELRYSNSENEAETTPKRAQCLLRPEVLLPLQLNQRDYGEELANQLFSDEEIKVFFGRIKAAVEGADQYLRIRLLVDQSAPELHALRWELLVDPETKAPIATSEKLLFSRFMLSNDWRTIRLRPKTALHALIAVSAPTNLDKYRLAPVDLDGEIIRAQGSMGNIKVTVLGKEQPLTINTLVQELRSGIDLLYLVCHGIMVDHVPYLFLQNDEGAVDRVFGEDLALRISEIPYPPRLIVLASCESAGMGETATAEASLAPRLANAGIPAVIAMQGKISMETVKAVMPVFFKELLEDGQIDRAMAVARGVVRDHGDVWMPALFMRLRGGRIWYESGFGRDENDTVKWKSLVNDITKGEFTPIIGWGLSEAVFGRTEELARQLALKNNFPMAPIQRGDLALVLQFLAVNQSRSYLADALQTQMCVEIKALHQDLFNQGLTFQELSKEIGHFHLQDKQDPYRILAALPAKVFITATPDNLLIQALEEAGKKPSSFYAIWKDNAERQARYKKEPTVEEPLVYHLFGHFDKRESLVLTEDDYFDYLIGASLNQKEMPFVVKHALTNQLQIFLGFQITDWSFRVLFRLIKSLGGKAAGDDYAHAAVQIDPEGDLIADVASARKYLKDYYYHRNKISIFWGGSDEFLIQLQQRLPRLDNQG